MTTVQLTTEQLAELVKVVAEQAVAASARAISQAVAQSTADAVVAELAARGLLRDAAGAAAIVEELADASGR